MTPGRAADATASDRPRRLLLLSHCILNQNAVVEPLARSGGVLGSAADWALDHGFELFQLPCPEFRFAGPLRPPGSLEDYDTPDFHASNARLLAPVVEQLRRYADAGYEIVGGLHVQGSPSCDPGSGHFVAALLDAARAAGIEIRQLWQVPETETGAFSPDDPASDFGDPSRRRARDGGRDA